MVDSTSRPRRFPQNASRSPDALARLAARGDLLWAAAILFANGWAFALPVTDRPLPFWATPIQVFRGLFLHEALFLAYVPFAFLTPINAPRSDRLKALFLTTMIAALGIAGMASIGLNARPFREVLTVGRYFVLAAYFLAAVVWGWRHGANFVLRTLLLGILGSAAVNVYFTFLLSPLKIGGLPVLLGQNGPGGNLGLSVLLSASLMLMRRTSFDTAVAIACGAVGVFVASISYSKLAMLMAASGVIGWLFVSGRNLTSPRVLRWYSGLAIVFLLSLPFTWRGIANYAIGVNAFIDYKFGTIDARSIETRSQYFLITAEILTQNPVLGVGHGGFYDAAIATSAYRNARAAIEDPAQGARGESHPESSFLYYAFATGMAGFIVISVIFTMAMALFGRVFWPQRLGGKGLWACVTVGYLIFGLTLPTLFNTSILYLPLAFALSSRRYGAGHSVARAAPEQARSSRPAPQVLDVALGGAERG